MLQALYVAPDCAADVLDEHGQILVNMSAVVLEWFIPALSLRAMAAAKGGLDAATVPMWLNWGPMVVYAILDTGSMCAGNRLSRNQDELLKGLITGTGMVNLLGGLMESFDTIPFDLWALVINVLTPLSPLLQVLRMFFPIKTRPWELTALKIAANAAADFGAGVLKCIINSELEPSLLPA